MAFIDRMEGQDCIDKTREYLDYLEEHLNNVKRAFNELSKICDGMWWVGDDCSWHTLRVEVEFHDLSKFSKEEFTQYRDNFFPVSKMDKDSSLISVGFDEALENHQKQNHHHHETIENHIDLIHMIIDWTAMGYKFGDTAQQYYESNKAKIILTNEQRKLMYEVFDRIRERT